MKKIIVLCLLGITLSGCGGSSDTSAKQADDKPKASTKAVKKSKANGDDHMDATNNATKRILKDVDDRLAANEWEAHSNDTGYGVDIKMTFNEDGSFKMTEQSQPMADGKTDLTFTGTYNVNALIALDSLAVKMKTAELNKLKTYDDYLALCEEKKEEPSSKYAALDFDGTMSGELKSAPYDGLQKLSNNNTIVTFEDDKLIFKNFRLEDNPLAQTDYGKVLTEFTPVSTQPF